MVGKGSKMRQRARKLDGPCFAEVMAEFIGKPFKKGGQDHDGAYDCITFVYYALSRLGKKPPHTVMGRNVFRPEEWVALWDEDRAAANELMKGCFEQIGEPIDPAYRVAGDLLLLRAPTGDRCMAIYGGNELIISSFVGRGVQVYSLDHLNVQIEGARRLRHGNRPDID